MPRKARAQRVNEHECHACGERFNAVRHDARYCGAKCRQQMSRSMRAIRVLKSVLGMTNGPKAAERLSNPL